MYKVVSDLFEAQGWSEAQPLNLESFNLTLTALFIAPSKDVVEQIFYENKSIEKKNLDNIIQQLVPYKLLGFKMISLIKDFSVDNKINLDLLKAILVENGMNKNDLDELLLAALGNDLNGAQIDITKLANGLDKLMEYDTLITNPM